MILFALLLGLFSLIHQVAVAETSDVRFIVGGLMAEEGGDWEQADGPLSNPFGLDFDSQGNMYIVELGGGRVHRLDPSGNLTQIAGDGSKAYTGDGGPAADATFNGMHNCAVTRDDQLLIADSWNHCVRRIDLDRGVIETIAGTGEEGFSGDGGPAKQATFNFLMCISLSPDKQTLHITDLKNHRVRNIDLDSNIVTTVAGNGEKGIPVDGSQATDSPLVDPRAAASDADGNLYVLERGGNALRVVHRDGSIHTVAGTGQKGYRDGPAMQAQFGSPKHVCTDPRGNVYIADDLNGAIRKYDPQTSQVTTVLGRGVGHPEIRLSHPHGVCYHQGILYVIDSGNSRIFSVRGIEP
jgi:sugar lactone lactonase YvrE